MDIIDDMNGRGLGASDVFVALLSRGVGNRRDADIEQATMRSTQPGQEGQTAGHLFST